MVNVLLPVDGSIRSIKSCEFIIDHLNSDKYTVYILHIMPSGGSITEAKKFVENAKRKLLDAGVKDVHTKIVESIEEPAEEILREAKKIKADIIIISAYGVHKGEDSSKIGSVAELVVNNSVCPVIIVKPLSEEK